MSYYVTARCPRCGNENPADNFQCSFCGYRLRIEKIENISIFKRVEKEWISPSPFYMKIYCLLTKPNYAFWDINHRRRDAPGFLIVFFNAILWGLMGLAVIAHFVFTPNDAAFYYGLTFFIIFFLFGFLFNLVFYTILVWLFIKGANKAVGFSKRLESRFGEKSKIIFSESEMSPFSIYKGGTLMQKQEANKYKMLFCAFAPFLVINAVKILILLVALPTVEVDTTAGGVSHDTFSQMFKSPVWAVLDVIDALTMAIWIPILMAIGIRELSKSSTIKVLISSFIIGTVVSIVFYFLRPTLFGF